MINMKSKLQKKYQQASNRNKSTSQQKNRRHRSNHQSSIFESCKNSLYAASPKLSQQNQYLLKYKTYMEFISSGKVMPQVLGKRKSNILQKKNSTNTPTPKRVSPAISQRQRKSINEKIISEQKKGQYAIRIHKKSSNQKNNPLSIKGKLIKQDKNVKMNNSQLIKKNQKKEKERKKSTIQQSIDSQNIQIQEKKLIQKLFKGIQFYRDLGRGAHALVRSAVDWNKKRKIAVKVYEKQELTNDQLQSIQREIQILTSLNHKNIIKLYEIIETYKTINLMIQYGGGNSLQQYMRSKGDGKLSEVQAKQIFGQVIRAVHYLHEMNIAHRDLKTQNILLNKHLQLKIIDFGFSLICSHDKKISSYCGTPTYMAPEVVSKTSHNPQLSDRWSLGILLYTMLNGHCPFKASTQKQLFKKINDGIYQYTQDISTQAKLLIESFLKRQPSERIQLEEALNSQWFK